MIDDFEMSSAMIIKHKLAKQRSKLEMQKQYYEYYVLGPLVRAWHKLIMGDLKLEQTQLAA